MTKMHLAIDRPGIFGGTSHTTACNRLSNANDDMNRTHVAAEVTCKLCVDRMKYLKPFHTCSHCVRTGVAPLSRNEPSAKPDRRRRDARAPARQAGGAGAVTSFTKTPTWKATRGTASVLFHAVGRGRRPSYFIKWNAIGRSGGEHAESFHAAEKRATALLDELEAAGLARADDRESPTYCMLDRVRNVLNNACHSPLPDADDQATVVLLLEQVRAIYRAAWDREREHGR